MRLPRLIIIIIIIIIRFIKRLRPWLQRRWRQVSRGCYSKALRKKYVLNLDLKTCSESALISVSGNEFQTVGAEQRKARLAKSVPPTVFAGDETMLLYALKNFQVVYRVELELLQEQSILTIKQ